MSKVKGQKPSRNIGFLDLDRVVVPASLVEAANRHLRNVGRQGYEGFALWAGRRQEKEFKVLETVIPAQHGIRSLSGVCVTVEAEELFRLNVHLFERGLSLIAQLHSHPGEAYHSGTDDSFPIATTAGALSLVIPDFAIHPFALERCATYRLIPGRGWVQLAPRTVRDLILVVDDVEEL
jgi:JAB domain-containing protein similar to deubiquitination enzymes